MSEQSPSSESRRKFLKRSVAVGAGAALVAAGAEPVTKFIEDVVKDNRETSLEKLKEKGLTDFIPFYVAVNGLLDTYRSKPTFSTSDYPDGDHSDPYYILERAAIESNFNVDQEGINTLRDHWGEKRPLVKEYAQAKIKDMEVIIDDPNLPDTKDEARKAYDRFTEVVPAMVMMGPNRLEIVSGGGGYMGPTYNDSGKAVKPYVLIESPQNDLEGFYRSGLHELAHAEVQWKDGKPFIERKAYADYVTIEAKNIKKVLDDYFSKDWKKAQKYLKTDDGGMPLVWYYDTDAQITYNSYDDLEKDFAANYGIHLDTIAPLTPDQQKNPSYKFNRLIWAVGKHQLEVKAREAKVGKDNLSQQDKDFLDYTDVGLLLDRAVGEVDHYFRGPVQKDGLGLPGVNFPPANPNDLITKANIEIQQARLRAFSTLSPHELQDFRHSSQALRNHFGIDNPPINTY